MTQGIVERYENNVDFTDYAAYGKYEIPVLWPEKWEPVTFVPFHEAKRVKKAEGTGIHFFVHDFLFQRLWTHREMYLPMLQRFDAVMTPDFSLYTDWPMVIQLYNHYRKHLLGAWLQREGVKVYPTIGWSDETSYDWCFDGEPMGGTVCVSSVGTQKSKETKRLFLRGYEAMLERLMPETIVFFGSVPAECKGNIVQMEPYYKKIEERKRKDD